MPLADVWFSLPSMAARLLRGQHSPDTACSLADAFNRWVAVSLGVHWQSHAESSTLLVLIAIVRLNGLCNAIIV